MDVGAFAAHPGHDAHMLTTLSSIQILLIQGAGEKLNVERITSCKALTFTIANTSHIVFLVILSLQNVSGSFSGDKWGEVDTRFGYCAIQALSLLGQLHKLDVDKTVSYFVQCKNYDGGFGSSVGGESHAAQGDRVLWDFIFGHSKIAIISLRFGSRPHHPRPAGRSRQRYACMVVI